MYAQDAAPKILARFRLAAMRNVNRQQYYYIAIPIVNVHIIVYWQVEVLIQSSNLGTCEFMMLLVGFLCSCRGEPPPLHPTPALRLFPSYRYPGYIILLVTLPTIDQKGDNFSRHNILPRRKPQCLHWNNIEQLVSLLLGESAT